MRLTDLEFYNSTTDEDLSSQDTISDVIIEIARQLDKTQPVSAEAIAQRDHIFGEKVVEAIHAVLQGHRFDVEEGVI